MDLEMVGRHALLFDDDAMAAFVNSGDALVEWNSLQIDRYDVRHLLSGPLPPRRRRNPQASSHLSDSSLNSELDHERYLDLPPPSDQPEVEEAEKLGGPGGYHAVVFSYGSTDDSADQNNADGGLECSRFRPPFPVPEDLLHSLMLGAGMELLRSKPPSEKVHQIIARTATFVSKHGGQSEIILRVKQGDNPTFGFLMPDHNLHAYFRFLVDHQEVLQSDSCGKTQSVDEVVHANQNKLGTAGALSLLGSVYGSGEDEDGIEEDGKEVENAVSGKVKNVTSSVASQGSEYAESSMDATEKEEPIAKHPLHNKGKPSALKKNPSIAVSKPGKTICIKKEDITGSYLASLGKSKGPLVLEPPSDLKILINKVVDFIMKNGKQFEATLREQDSKQGRFPFLVPSDRYHPHYQKVLQKAQESKVSGNNSNVKDDSARGLLRKNSLCKEDDAISSTYIDSDLPSESDRREKFKMKIGKSKKDLEDPPSKSEQECRVSVDAEAAAAILQAATRGFKSSSPEIISSTTQGHGSEVRQALGFGCNSSAPEAKTIGTSAASVSTSETGAEAHLTKEQKLKAERLKRAKMFVATLKSGAVPSKTESLRALSAEPSEPEVLGSFAEVDPGIEEKGSSVPAVSGSTAEVNPGTEERKGSSASADFITLEKNENSERNFFADDSERRSRRKYRSRSERQEDDDEEELEQDNSEKDPDMGQGDEDKNHKHSRKKHRSHHSSREKDYDNDYKREKSHRRSSKRHRSHHSSEEEDHGQKDADTSYHKHSRKKHSSRRSSHDEEDIKDRKRSRKKHRSHHSLHRNRDSAKHRKVDSSGDEDCQVRKHDNSSGAEHGRYDRYVEDSKGFYLEKEELEEGEISSKFSDQSRSVGGRLSRETSVDMANSFARASSQPFETTQVSDDLRAKIRAMLMTTR